MIKREKSRLQFVHCDTLFKTREDAMAYVNGDVISITRPSLYAEPMILKYGDENNPNIILAIGSVGDGVTQSIKNKVFFIDFAELYGSLKNVTSDSEILREDIDNITEILTERNCAFFSNSVAYHSNIFYCVRFCRFF